MGASRTICRVAILAIAFVVGVGCTSGADDTGSAATNSPQAGDVPPPPEIGQCRNTPASNLGANDWVDETPAVDCSRPHTLETLDVIEPAGDLTLSVLKQFVDHKCNTPAAGAYVDSPDFGAYRIAYPIVYWPSVEQRAAGQAWVRCDIGIHRRTFGFLPKTSPHPLPLALQTESLRGAMGEDLARFHVCMAQLPDPGRTQPLTSCKQPHRAEELSTLLVLAEAVVKFPSEAALRSQGRSGCAKLVAHRDDNESLVVTPVWESKKDWSGGSLYGWCWINRHEGLLPPIK